MVKLKVRAVGLEFEISKWIDKNLMSLRDCYIVAQQPNIATIDPNKVASAKSFV